MLHPLDTRRYTELCDRLRSFLGELYSQQETDKSLLGKFVRLPSNTKYAGTVTKVYSHGILILTGNNSQIYIPFGSEIIVIEGDKQ